jgi:hypothetical protein
VQTLKTAIVVLLMMTVIYGSYVSLTTPPDALPDQVAELIQESGTFELDIDEGLPESLANLDLENAATESSPPTAPGFANEDPDHSSSPDPTMISGLDAPGIPTEASAPVSETFSDASPSGTSTPIAKASDTKPKAAPENLAVTELQLPQNRRSDIDAHR